MNTRSLLPRTRVGIVLLTAVAVSALASCGVSNTGAGDETDSAAASASSGPWRYTDDTGTDFDLDSQPTRIAAFADQALALLSNGIQPVAIFGRTDVASDPRFADYDLSGTKIVGNTYGEIDLDVLAETAPQLIVTGIYPTDRAGTLDTAGPYYGVADSEQQKQLEKIAPVAAIEIGGAGLDVVQSTTALAEALGADKTEIADARADFDAASQALGDAFAAHPDIEVTQLYAAADGIYVVKVDDEPETQMYRTFGANYTDLNPDGDYYWDIYSWENASKMMTGDVILANVEGYQADELADQPTFADDPALKASQVYSWNGAAMDYTSQAEQMNRLADLVNGAHDVA